MLVTVGSPLTQPRLQTRNHGAARAPVGSKTRAVPCASPWVRSGVYRSPAQSAPGLELRSEQPQAAYPPPTSKRRTSAVWLPATWPGTLDGWHCSQCGSRLCFSVAKGRFEYFFCLGRQRDTASCNQPHSPAEVVERLVESVECRATLPSELRVALDQALDREVEVRVAATAESSRNARRELDRLSTRRSRLLDAYLGGAVNLLDFQAEQSAILAATRSAEQRLHRNELSWEKDAVESTTRWRISSRGTITEPT